MLWLSHTTHLVGGLRFDRQGRLWAFDSQAFVVLTVSREGEVQKRDFGTRPFSNVNFCSDGSLYLAEHVTGNGIKMEIQARMGTRLQRMPGTDRLGDGHVWHYRADGTLLRELATQVHGGIGGFMGVTMSALSPDESTLVYCSETGTRLMRYDLESARQLPDLQCLPEGEREMFFAMDYGPHGRLYVSRGTRVDLVSPEGRTMCCYPLDGHGWATLKAAADGRHLYIGNYFTGQLVKLELESGEQIAMADTGVQRSLADRRVRWRDACDADRGRVKAPRGALRKRSAAARSGRRAAQEKNFGKRPGRKKAKYRSRRAVPPSEKKSNQGPPSPTLSSATIRAFSASSVSPSAAALNAARTDHVPQIRPAPANQRFHRGPPHHRADVEQRRIDHRHPGSRILRHALKHRFERRIRRVGTADRARAQTAARTSSPPRSRSDTICRGSAAENASRQRLRHRAVLRTAASRAHRTSRYRACGRHLGLLADRHDHPDSAASTRRRQLLSARIGAGKLFTAAF